MAEPFLPIYDPNVSVPTFGTSPPQRGIYPNDGIILDVYNYTNDYLESTFRVQNYTLDNFQATINVEQELKDLQYLSGKYNVEARFYRNYLGSGDGDRLRIEEVSSDRFEIRVTPQLLITGSTNNLISYFQTGFFDVDKQQILPNLYVFKDSFSFIQVFDYVQDPFTFDTPPFSIIFKLGAPLPNNIQVGDLVWVAQEISNRVRDSVTVIPVAPQFPQTYIAGPNFDVITQNTTNIGTEYKDWDDVLTTNTDTSLSIINNLFSGSLIEGIPLNIDFKEFTNFVHFGSVEERLHNFKYKLQLIEDYDDKIATLSTNYTAFPANSGLTSSVEFVGNVLDFKRKKNTLIGTFDTYEKYLYYESASYVTNSFGEYYPTTWPKSTSTKPYVNYSVTASQSVEWFNGIITSASVYDQNNSNNLRKLIPLHVLEDPVNEEYVLFVDMIGHYFDLIYAYIKQLTSINERYESLTEGFAKDLVFQVGQSLGLSAENGAPLEELWRYVLGTNETGSYISSTYKTSIQDRTKETWKRIIANLPYLLKTKGTARGIRALINCYGIPSTVLRVREFGGPEPIDLSSTYLEYDQFYYGLLVSGSYQVSADVNTGTSPAAFELRFRVDTSILTSSLSYDLLDGIIGVTVSPGNDTIVVGSQTFSASFSESDTDWWWLAVNNNSTAYVGTNKWGKAVIYSSSAAVGSLNTGTTIIPGSSAPKFIGTVGEFRVWSQSLDLAVIENHILAPTSFQGPLLGRAVGSTSSFNTLLARYPLGNDSKKLDLSVYTTTTSSHPDQTKLTWSGGGNKVATFTGYGSDTASYWIPQVETQYLEWLDGGANRTLGNKVRIESSIVTGSNYLSKNTTIIRSLQDQQPIDSSRVGVYFSPNDEVNEDISEQFGGYSIDEFIGDPSDYYKDDYKSLERIRHEYFKKYQRRNNVQGFIRLMQNYDSSLFQLVKQFVPERALLHTGLAIESTPLHRNKIANKRPSYEDLSYEGTIDSLKVFREDPLDAFDTTYEAETNARPDEALLDGSSDAYDGLLTLNIATPEQLTGVNGVALIEGSSLEIISDYQLGGEVNNSYSTYELADIIDVTFDEPARYNLYTWYHTGSGDNDWVYSPSVGVNYSDGVQPAYMQNRLSDIYKTEWDRTNGSLLVENLNLLSSDLYTNTLRVLGFPLYDGANGTSITTFDGETVLRYRSSP